MHYKLKLTKSVLKFLDKHTDLAPKIMQALHQIAVSPFDNDLDIKRLHGQPNSYRLRLGKYRILYEILEDEILIYAYKADSRGDIK